MERAGLFDYLLAPRIVSMTESITAIKLAPLHGTILSIIIGAFFVYANSLFWRLDDSRQLVLREAEKINYINVAGSYDLTGAPEYQSNDDDVREQLLSRLTTLWMHSVDEEASERGREILKIISALSHNYPFPQRAHTDEGGIRITEPESIEFHTINEVQKWRTDIEMVSGKIFWLMDVHKSKLNESINAFQQAQQRSQLNMEPLEYVRRHLSPGEARDIEDILSRTAATRGNFGSLLVNGFIENLKQANGISFRVGEALRHYQILERSIPSKCLFSFTFIFGAIAFVGAVIFPMFSGTLHSFFLCSFFWKEIPVFFYLWSLVILLSQIMRLLWR
jgi:hypothetical protein